LAAGELGLETDTNKMKFGNGASHWSVLPYANIGNTGPVGPVGPTGTGLTRTTTATITFGNEDTYVEIVINDAAILSSSKVIVQPTGEEFILQDVTCGLVSIVNGVSYTIYANAPLGATGTMTVNILIF
jgi:hypothetical protein